MGKINNIYSKIFSKKAIASLKFSNFTKSTSDNGEARFKINKLKAVDYNNNFT